MIISFDKVLNLHRRSNTPSRVARVFVCNSPEIRRRKPCHKLRIKCTSHTTCLSALQHYILNYTVKICYFMGCLWSSQSCTHTIIAQSLHGQCSHDTAIARSRHGSCMVTPRQLHGHDTAVHGHDMAVHGHDTVAQHARTSHGTGNSMHGSCAVMHTHSQKCRYMHGRPFTDRVSSKIIIIV